MFIKHLEFCKTRYVVDTIESYSVGCGVVILHGTFVSRIKLDHILDLMNKLLESLCNFCQVFTQSY